LHRPPNHRALATGSPHPSPERHVGAEIAVRNPVVLDTLAAAIAHAAPFPHR
jgi:hypothetical protein